MSHDDNTIGVRATAAYAFPKDYRLLKTDDYSSVFAFKKAMRSRHFLLHYRPRAAADEPTARLGLVVAKRHLRRAVDRNLVRRLVRETFRLLRVQLRPCDMVIRLAVKPASLDRPVLVHEVETLFRRFLASG